MSRSLYVPRGYPSAAIRHLQELGPGVELSTAALAEAIGLDHPSAMHQLMSTAVRAGYLRSRRVGQYSQWSLGEAIPAEGRAFDDVGGQPTQIVRHPIVSVVRHANGDVSIVHGRESVTLEPADLKAVRERLAAIT